MNRFDRNAGDKRGLRFGEIAACPSIGIAHDRRLSLAGTAPIFLPNDSAFAFEFVKPAPGLSEESESWN